jgi:hypothetical protein
MAAVRPSTSSLIPTNVKQVLVDKQSVGPVASYPFNKVTADHIITANFVSPNIQRRTDKDFVRVLRGQTASLLIKLSENPQTDAAVTVAWESGRPALSIRGVASLIFTPGNWETYQMVIFTATPDSNDLNSTAVFNLSGPGLISKQVTVEKVATAIDIGALFLLLD